ncbi:MAG: hypothetical protein ACRDPD_31210 [Streptosporangiaceae bacterium]
MLRAETRERDAEAWFSSRPEAQPSDGEGIAELGYRLPDTGHPGEITLGHLSDLGGVALAQQHRAPPPMTRGAEHVGHSSGYI